jgi:hypothetical protein
MCHVRHASANVGAPQLLLHPLPALHVWLVRNVSFPFGYHKIAANKPELCFAAVHSQED